MELENLPEIDIDASKSKIIIILPYFNESLGKELLENVKEELHKRKVQEKNIKIIRVAGALEIPFACAKVIDKKRPDAIITLGAIIRGDTSHYELVCEQTYQGIMKVQLEKKIPIIFGILTCETAEQAKLRTSKSGLNKGKQFALAALIQTTI